GLHVVLGGPSDDGSRCEVLGASVVVARLLELPQPVTSPQIDSIRGVSSDGVLRNLLSKGLAEESGRAEGPGRPILYVTTSEFLGHFGLASLEEMPQLFIPEDEAAPGEETEEELMTGFPA
ncbi:MAG: SMC-Scp complex subunit ScpB, partial [Chloroflexi bacterium]|nr:SMC-Scp complex subunit ScpB [Chloroflexota bacterium]